MDNFDGGHNNGLSSSANSDILSLVSERTPQVVPSSSNDASFRSEDMNTDECFGTHSQNMTEMRV